MPLASVTRSPQALGQGGGLGVYLHAVGFKQFGHRQFGGAVYPGVEFGVQRFACQCGQHGTQVGFGHGAALAAVPQGAQGVVQAAVVLAQLEVEAQSHQRTLV